MYLHKACCTLHRRKKRNLDEMIFNVKIYLLCKAHNLTVLDELNLICTSRESQNFFRETTKGIFSKSSFFKG